MNADRVIALLGLEPLKVEGGLWAQTWLDGHSSAIYYLLRPGDFSALHRLGSVELWHHYAGAPVQMLLLHATGDVRRPVLGDDIVSDHRPVVAVPSGTWMGAFTTGEWSLVGTTMSPPYDPAAFELGSTSELVVGYPSAVTDIERLVRDTV